MDAASPMRAPCPARVIADRMRSSAATAMRVGSTDTPRCRSVRFRREGFRVAMAVRSLGTSLPLEKGSAGIDAGGLGGRIGAQSGQEVVMAAKKKKAGAAKKKS